MGDSSHGGLNDSSPASQVAAAAVRRAGAFRDALAKQEQQQKKRPNQTQLWPNRDKGATSSSSSSSSLSTSSSAARVTDEQTGEEAQKRQRAEGAQAASDTFRGSDADAAAAGIPSAAAAPSAAVAPQRKPNFTGVRAAEVDESVLAALPPEMAREVRRQMALEELASRNKNNKAPAAAAATATSAGRKRAPTMVNFFAPAAKRK